MRVHPARPSNPLTATVIDSLGERSAACSAAQRPAPPAPRIRMSVSRLSIVKSAVIPAVTLGAAPAARPDYSLGPSPAQTPGRWRLQASDLRPRIATTRL